MSARIADLIDLVGHDDSSQRSLEVGRAAEHLVCADLILSGYRAFMSEQGLPYDLVVDNGKRLLRIQVKSTFAPKIVPKINWTRKYTWYCRRVGRDGKREVAASDFDILALVAIDIRKVAYIPISGAVPSCIRLRPPGPAVSDNPRRDPLFAKAVDEFPISDAMKEFL